jgi:hypothetical protein
MPIILTTASSIHEENYEPLFQAIVINGIKEDFNNKAPLGISGYVQAAPIYLKETLGSMPVEYSTYSKFYSLLDGHIRRIPATQAATRLQSLSDAIKAALERLRVSYDTILESTESIAYAHTAFLANHFVFEDNTREYLTALYAERPLRTQVHEPSTSAVQRQPVRFAINPRANLRQPSFNMSRNYVENSISGGLGERGFIKKLNPRGQEHEVEELMPEGYFGDIHPVDGHCTQRYNLIIRNLTIHVSKLKTGDDFRKWWPMWRENIHLMDLKICPWASRIIFLKNLLEGEPAEELNDKFMTGIHQNDYHRIMKALFIKHTKDQSSHLSVIAAAQQLKVTGYSCTEVMKYIREQMSNVDIIRVYDPEGTAWGTLLYERIMQELPMEARLVLGEHVKFGCDSDDYQGILEHGLPYLYKVLDKKPIGLHFQDPTFGIGEGWKKVIDFVASSEKNAGMKVLPVKRGPPPPQNNPPKRTNPPIPPTPAVVHQCAAENKEEEMIDISQTPWAAQVAESYRFTDEQAEVLYQIQDKGKWPTRKPPDRGGKEKPKKCSFCLETTHNPWECTMSMNEKHAKCRENKICRKCLQIGHTGKACPNPNRPCGRCKSETHNKALCIAKMQTESFPEGGEKIRGINNRLKGNNPQKSIPNKDNATVLQVDMSNNDDSEDGEELPETAAEFLIQ